MIFFSAGLRFFLQQYQAICSRLRVFKLNLLYPGASIDYKTNIEPGCNIICVKGGILNISNCSIKSGTQIFADTDSKISIKDSFIGRNCVVVAKEMITIEPGCLIAEMVVIRDQDHSLNISGKTNSRDIFTTAPISIEENVWLASRVTILKGVTIGKFAVIAASGLVNSNVPPKELWGGLPAKFLKKID